MQRTVLEQRMGPITLNAQTAADLMTRNPVSIRACATVGEATALLIDKGFQAAPVINESGRPVGVLSQVDLLTHQCESLAAAGGAPADGAGPRADDLMTPVVFAVAPDTPARDVVRDMLRLNVHRLFVIDRAGVLVGVISALDVLRHLRD